MQKDLARIRNSGFAATESEKLVGARGIAAPIFDANGIFGSFCITCPKERIPLDRIEDFSKAVKTAAQEYSHSLGGGRSRIATQSEKGRVLRNAHDEQFVAGIDHQAWLANIALGEHERKGPAPAGHMLLRTTDTSPYARKVRIVADYLGLAESIILTPANLAPSGTELINANPLGKAPTLILDDGQAIFESTAIIQFLCDQAPARAANLTSTDSSVSLANLQIHAIADGVTNAAMAIVMERRVHQGPAASDGWIERQTDKIMRCLGYLNDRLDTIPLPGTGSIATACALGYLDWRGPDWREPFAPLADWLTEFGRTFPSFAATDAR